MPTGKKYSSKENQEKIKRALKYKTLTQKQVDTLPEKLLMGIINKRGCGCGCKGGSGGSPAASKGGSGGKKKS